jgi:hypothetical protein
LEKKTKAEAKRARRSQRKLELEAGANHPDAIQDDEVKAPEADSTNSTESS